MHQLIIAQEHTSFDVSENDRAIFALESFLSADQFKEAFTKSINDFIEELKPFEEKTARLNKVFSQQLNLSTMKLPILDPEAYKQAEQAFIEAYAAENEFITENGIFSHNGFKAEKVKFKPFEGRFDFEVYDLFDWFEMKKKESSENFETSHVRYVDTLG